MMDKQLFRGFHRFLPFVEKDIETTKILVGESGKEREGYWVTGDGVHYPKSYNYIGRCFIDTMAKRANDWLEVIPETLGLCTGAFSADGTLIFQDDVVFHNNRYSVVFFDDRQLAWALRVLGFGGNSCPLALAARNSSVITVGTIFDGHKKYQEWTIHNNLVNNHA